MIPELKLITPVRNGTVAGVGRIVEDVVQLRAGGDGETVVARIVPGPIDQNNGRANA